MDVKLILEKAKKEIRQREAVGEQSQQLQVAESSNHSSVGETPTTASATHYNGQRSRDKTDHKYTGCGHTKHKPGDRCPAKTATCHKCKRKGYYSSVYRRRQPS